MALPDQPLWVAVKNLTHDVCEAFPGDHLYDTAEKTVKAFVDVRFSYTCALCCCFV